MNGEYHSSKNVVATTGLSTESIHKVLKRKANTAFVVVDREGKAVISYGEHQGCPTWNLMDLNYVI